MATPDPQPRPAVSPPDPPDQDQTFIMQEEVHVHKLIDLVMQSVLSDDSTVILADFANNLYNSVHADWLIL